MATLRGGPGVLDSALALNTNTDPVTSSTYYGSPGHSTVAFSCKSTRAGTWTIYGKLLGGDRVALTDARALTGGTADAASVPGPYAAGYSIDVVNSSGLAGTVDIACEGEDSAHGVTGATS